MPQTFTLDDHTKHFFDPTDWEGAVAARFQSESPGMAGVEFAARAAKLHSGAVHLVVQAVSQSPDDRERGGCLVSTLPFAARDFEGRAEHVRTYFARHLRPLQIEGAPQGARRRLMLRGPVGNSGFTSTRIRVLAFSAKATGAGS